MKSWNSPKLTVLYEELIFLKNQGQLSFAGERELLLVQELLFGKAK